MEKRFAFFRLWLLVASFLFSLQAFSWIIIGSFDIFGLWDRLMYSALFNNEKIAEVETFKSFILGPFGASLFGYFMMVFCVVWFAFPQKKLWAYWTVIITIYAWFIPDSISSIFHGALFNVLLVNIPSITLLSIPLAFLYPYFHSIQESAV